MEAATTDGARLRLWRTIPSSPITLSRLDGSFVLPVETIHKGSKIASSSIILTAEDIEAIYGVYSHQGGQS